MAQQTAVEWLCMQLLDLDNHKIWPSLLERAKNMENQHIEQACIEVAEEAKKILREELKELIVLPKDWIYENNK